LKDVEALHPKYEELLAKEGITREVILEARDLFLETASKCRTVICCRADPIQKATVVKSIKNKFQTVTMSVGDGANDVSMIMEANIGVGIYGEEGM
jgi:phospholipid-translocating ATPase